MVAKKASKSSKVTNDTLANIKHGAKEVAIQSFLILLCVTAPCKIYTCSTIYLKSTSVEKHIGWFSS